MSVNKKVGELHMSHERERQSKKDVGIAEIDLSCPLNPVKDQTSCDEIA